VNGVISLERLAGVLTPWPVRPLAVLELLADPDGRKRFGALVREVFPQQAQTILAAHPSGDQTQIEAIINAFLSQISEHYFPVDEFWADDATFGDFLAEIPLGADAWDEERLHSVPELPSPEARLVVGLLTPFLTEAVGDGVLEEMLADLCGTAVLRWLPSTPPGDREVWLLRVSGGPYPAIADMYRWLHKETGCPFLDYDPADWDSQTGLEWDMPTLRWLREQFGAARGIKDRIHRLGDWLAADPATRVVAVLKSIYGEETTHASQDTDSAITCPTPAGDGAAEFSLPVGGAARPQPGGPFAARAALPPGVHYPDRLS
jgi:hypothetical protein